MPRETVGQINHSERLRFILTMFYCTTCRIGEFSTHTMGSFQEHTNGKWYWHVLGKSSKAAILPVNHLLLDALVRYRNHHNLSPLPVQKDKTPLLLNKAGNKNISSRQLSRILDKFYHFAANEVEHISPHSAENIRNATAHWLRHTALSHAAKRTQDLRLVKRFGRHEHIQTSMRYIHIDDQELEELITQETPV